MSDVLYLTLVNQGQLSSNCAVQLDRQGLGSLLSNTVSAHISANANGRRKMEQSFRTLMNSWAADAILTLADSFVL